jgi:addiction module HigA family antidote
MRAHTFSPDYAVPPGETLIEVLDEQGMSQAELARRTDFSAKHINQIAKGLVPISTETALRLERATGVPARLWINLESRFQEHRARINEDVDLSNDLDLLDRLPIAAMVTTGILTKRLKPLERLREVLAFFGVANKQAWEETWADSLAASFRKSHAHQSDPGAVAVWLRLGELSAADIKCAAWNPSLFKSALKRIRSLTRDRDPESWHPELVRECADAGVAVVVVPEVSGARTHGAARWLSPNKALIQLSLRYRWSDIFWFSLFHEAKHILDQAKRSIILETRGATDGTDDERRADRFAADFLIPPDLAEQLHHLRSRLDVEVFAESIGLHPGIVVGRLQHDEVWPPSHGNGLRERLVLTDD